MNLSELIPLIFFLGAGAFYSVRSQKLTAPAALAGVLLAGAVFAGAGFTGLAMMAFFFLSGTAATSWKWSWKQRQGLAESEKGTRSPGQVIANAGAAALSGLAGILAPSHRPLCQLMMAAAFSAATADTLSSELGNLYGRKFYTILGFKSDQRGRNGVISLEGSLFGLAGSAGMAAIYATGALLAGYGFQGRAAGIIILAGTIGNFMDSLLGATLENRQYIGNNAVNFFNTTLASLSAWVCVLVLPGPGPV